ncbi:endocuticle structural glycoprotein SgAbd-8-like [Daphnia pulicaria]|uniref:endocuticle structural glycoprotein SgAbd-8-like n=1 Tax=Daphnia pulicaria TaxID=35523 RepID=UPI001EEA4DD3|nr:endocuticle structural glycoprotein SgAbd-8-like [Daphnia pulicaria]
MKLFVIAAVLAVAAAAPSSYKPEYKAPAYSATAYAAPSYSAPAYTAPAYTAPAYAAPAYAKDNKYTGITITSQSDERNLDGSSQWSYAQSDYTTREESQVQKKMQGVAYDSYGKATYEDVMGNTNKGSCYWVSPEGEKFTLTWVADEQGFQPKDDHLPVAPVHVYELPVAPVHEYELPVAPALPYKRTGLGYSGSSYY